MHDQIRATAGKQRRNRRPGFGGGRTARELKRDHAQRGVAAARAQGVEEFRIPPQPKLRHRIRIELGVAGWLHHAIDENGVNGEITDGRRVNHRVEGFTAEQSGERGVEFGKRAKRFFASTGLPCASRVGSQERDVVTTAREVRRQLRRRRAGAGIRKHAHAVDGLDGAAARYEHAQSPRGSGEGGLDHGDELDWLGEPPLAHLATRRAAGADGDKACAPSAQTLDGGHRRRM